MANESAATARYLAEYGQRAQQALDRWLPAQQTHPAQLHEAMRYAALGGGKYIRPTLAYATAHALGTPLSAVDGVAAAVELIHAYSLVHDDLPAMDNDDLRRGKPSCHKAYGEAMAILAGDALQALAFYILAHDPSLHATPAARLRMLESLALASGSRGMAGGQAIDLSAVGRKLDIAELEDMHIHKTGALIRASVLLSAINAGADPATLQTLDHFGKCVGLAFQIHDDILDVEGDTATLGKQSGADSAHDKPAYPALIGLTAAKERSRELIGEALASLAERDDTADPLRAIARYAIQRTR